MKLTSKTQNGPHILHTEVQTLDEALAIIEKQRLNKRKKSTAPVSLKSEFGQARSRANVISVSLSDRTIKGLAHRIFQFLKKKSLVRGPENKLSRPMPMVKAHSKCEN